MSKGLFKCGTLAREAFSRGGDSFAWFVRTLYSAHLSLRITFDRRVYELAHREKEREREGVFDLRDSTATGQPVNSPRMS